MRERIVSSKNELVEEINNLFVGYDQPFFQVLARGSEEGCDLIVEADIDERHFRFAVICKLRPTAGQIEEIASSDRRYSPLLATVRLTDSMQRVCREHNVGCIDLNGRLWLRGEGLLIDRSEQRGQVVYRSPERPISFFSSKSSRLARMLLSHSDREWTQKELSDLTGVSQGLVSRLLNFASGEGWVEGDRGNWTVRDFDALLDAWARSDNWKKRGVIRQYSGIADSLGCLARELLKAMPGKIAYTQWFAANLRFPYTEPPLLSAYCSKFLDEADRTRLRLREVDNGGKLWVIVPNDPGVFHAVQRVDGLPLVCDAQIYVDLLQVGLRGPEQAEALREWEGFSANEI